MRGRPKPAKKSTLRERIVTVYGEETLEAARKRLCEVCMRGSNCRLLPLCSDGSDCPYFAKREVNADA